MALTSRDRDTDSGSSLYINIKGQGLREEAMRRNDATQYQTQTRGKLKAPSEKKPRAPVSLYLLFGNKEQYPSPTVSRVWVAAVSAARRVSLRRALLVARVKRLPARQFAFVCK